MNKTTFVYREKMNQQTNPKYVFNFDFDFGGDDDVYLMIFKEINTNINHSIKLKLDDEGKTKLLKFAQDGEDVDILSKDGVRICFFTEYITYKSEKGEDVKEITEDCGFYMEIGSKDTNYQMGYPQKFKLEIMKGINTLLCNE